MKKFGAFVFALIGLAVPASAQKSISVPLFSNYNLASTSYISCATTGDADDVWGAWRQVSRKITTSGSSTTVTSYVSGSSAFANVSVGDELLITIGSTGLLASGSAVTTTPGAETRRYVTAKASADSITVNAAVDLSAGYNFYYRKLVCSTAATSGWFGVQGMKSVGWHFQVSTINATSIDMKVECRVQGSVDVIVTAWDENYTGAGSHSASISGDLHYDACRMMMKVNTDTGDQAVTGYVTGDK